METNTLIIIINIAIIGIIASVIVKLYYKDEESKNKQSNDLGTSNDSQFQNVISSTRNAVTQTKDKITGKKENTENRTQEAHNNVSNYFNGESSNSLSKTGKIPDDDTFIIPESKKYTSWEEPREIETEDSTIASKVFQEPIEDKHRDIISKAQNKEEYIKLDDESTKPLKDRVEEIKKLKDDETTEFISNEEFMPIDDVKKDNISPNIAESKISTDDEDLKDLFNIDELIEKAKEKDNTAINISENKEPKTDIEEIEKITEKTEIGISNEDQIPKTDIEEIEEVFDKNENSIDIIDIDEDSKENILPKYETPSLKEDTPTSEKKTTEDMNDSGFIEGKKYYEEGVNLFENKEAPEDEFGKPLNENDIFGESDVDPLGFSDLKDSVKNSKIFKNVKGFAEDKLIDKNPRRPDDEFIRNVKSYDIEEEPKNLEDKLREENTRKIFNLTQEDDSITPETIDNSKKPLKKAKKVPISQNSITVNINNNEELIKKGDSIIFNYNGESYSSRLINIRGDDLEVKYRGKTVLIKPSDVKKRF
ncbi:hypothetical protein LJB96_03235 [Methanobrevibacter sp. OttesenSCG-928-K11]|nr:hypothetical protein [Methanobrevibacter sp. OttesenSCG-928-K11]MDL2270773.1 hypothetical protein [Methanobrevibacter sp. OttesenSCG-928-I08]